MTITPSDGLKASADDDILKVRKMTRMLVCDCDQYKNKKIKESKAKLGQKAYGWSL